MSASVTSRYAEALFEVAEEHGKLDEIEEQLQAVVQAFHDEGVVKGFLNPRFDSEEKKNWINALSGTVEDQVVNFLKVLVDHHREELLADILKGYTAIVNEKRGVVEATVTTAAPLADAEKQKLTERFGKVLNKTVRLNEKVDRNLIGGILIRVGDRVYDGTVAGKLSRFKRSLTQVG
ncbi:MAG TPA: F0F1 ATP synthase subunit delta [Bacillales bacterium]|nr:F0F1 ATP synthase subunit delta [Bacillales bacterium]